MAFFTENNLIQGTPLTLDDTEVSFMDYLKAAAGDAWADNPSVALKRLGDVYTAQVGEDAVVDLAMSNDLSVDLDSYEPTAGPELSMDEQADIIKAAGLETHLKPQKGYNREALDIIMGRKREELDRAMTREQAPAWMAPFGFAAGLVTSFADPINLASNFIPVVGEQRVLRLLQQAKTPMGRAGIRAGVGAAEGAVGAAVVEPLVYLSRTQEQADYDMTDSLLNVAFGAIMGGAMHSATGAIGDWVRSRRGQRQPWEVKAPTDQSELRRTQFADELFSASREAGASITREQAEATAVLFDARARTWAYDEGKDAVEYYDTWKPDFRAAVETLKAEADLEQGMQRSQRLVLDEFKADARGGAVEYFVPEETPDAVRTALGINDLIINLPSNYVRHLDNDHPKMADALFADTTRILKHADQVVAVGRTREGTPKYAAVLHEGDEATVVVMAVSQSKKKGNRASPITSYKNSAERIDAIINKHSRAARSTDAGSDPSLLKPLNEDEVRAFATLEESMADEVREVKRPAQQMQEAIARESAGPDVTDPAMGPATLYQWQNLPEWEERTTAWMRNDGRSEEEISKYLAAVRGQMAIYEALGPKIMDQVVGAGQATRTKRNFGVAYSGPVRSNADEIYMVSFDASSQCVKRLGAAKTAQMAEQMLGRPLQVDEQMALIALYRAAGKEAPCLYCYVESNRRKATAAVGTAREVIISGEIPKSWGKDRKAAAQAAIDLAKAEGLTLDDIEFDYILDPRKGSTPEAIEAKERYKPIYDFLNSEALATKQNQVKLYEEYRGELLDITPEQIEALNGYAGLRFFSSSDFQVEHVVDLIQSFWDMKALGAKSHAYTKVPLYVDIFGETGQKINMSIFAEVDKDGNIRPDLQQGWDWQAAKAQREKHPDVGTIIVTANDKILKWALEQDWIDYCIPFHYSGLEKKYYTTMEWQDFTATQVERLVYPDKTPKGVRPSEVVELQAKPEAEASVEYARICFERKAYPIKVEELFADIANDATLKKSQKQTAAKERWKTMVDSGEFRPEAIAPDYFGKRMTAGKTTKDKPIYPVDVPRVRMHEMGTMDGISNEQGTRNYLELCLERKLYPVFTDFLFKDFQVAADAKARTAQVKEAKARWKAMVDKGEIDWDQINPNFFKVKKDYARTDTAFRVVEPEKIDTVAAEQPLRETLDKGLDAKYAGDEDIARAIVELSEYGRLNNVAIGPRALEASKRRQDIRSAIMGTEAQPTNYIEADPNVLYQTAYHGTPHRFDAFTLEAIGSGEGAQAHGWGLYFAERKRTAEKYRKGLSAPNIVLSVEGKKYRWKIKDDWESYWVNTETGIPADDFEQDHLSRMLRKAEGDAREEDYLSAVEEWLQDENLTEEQRGHLIRQREEYLNSEAKLEGQGQLFELEIPDNDVLLDEQKTFDEQPEKVKEALRTLGIMTTPEEFRARLAEKRQELDNAKKRHVEIEELISAEHANDEKMDILELLEALEEDPNRFSTPKLETLHAEQNKLNVQIRALEREIRALEEFGAATFHWEDSGRGLYKRAVDMFGSPRAASEALNEAGIKGITYDGRRDGRCFVVFDDKAIDVLNTFYQRGERVPGQPMDSAPTPYGVRAAATYGRMPMGEPRARVKLDPEADGKAVIEFFKAADPTSAPHELYHIFRRELAMTAMAEGASEKSKRMWKEACEFVGAKEGQPWTRAQEEKFAQAGERFLMEGVAPRPELQGLFERLKQWFLEVYTSVEAAGFEISDGMRKVFGDMLALSPEESDAMFRYGFGRMMEQSPADGIDTSVVKPMDDSAPAADVLTALQADSEARLNESFARLNPDSDAARELQQEFKETMGAADAELEKIQLEAEILREAALCDLRR